MQMSHLPKEILLIAVLMFAVVGLFSLGNTEYSLPDMSSRTQISVTVGSGNQQAQIPMNMYYRTSLFETVFLASEINAAGVITDLLFYNNFIDNLPGKPTWIWLGETAAEDLSGGWIPSSQLTQVFLGNVDYPSGANTVSIHLTTPYTYGGGNLVLMVHRPWEEDYYSPQDLFLAQTVGDSRSLSSYNHNTQINPDNPPATGVTGQFPKTTFIINVDCMGSLSGNVSSSGSPLEGARVVVETTPQYRMTGANGNYNFPYLPAGTYTVTASKTGFAPVSHTVTITAGQAATQNFALTGLPEVSIEGRVVGSDAPTIGIANASVALAGYAEYSTTTDGNGFFMFPSVYANQTYTYTISSPGYQVLTGEAAVGASNLIMGDIVLSEMAYAPVNVLATEHHTGDLVNITWDEPSIAEEGWIHYDSGENNSSFGTAGSLSFEVAARFPADSLATYVGGFLQAVKIWPAMGGNFAVHVWTGGDASGPGQLVVDQDIIPVLNAWNTVQLDFPIPVTGTEEIWIGFLCDVTGVNPAYAGFDYGPAVDGFGNLIFWQGNWTTLLAVNSYCDFNWNIQGYVGLTPPALETRLAPELTCVPSAGRSLVGYRVWRLLQGQANNENLWISLTDQPITGLAWQDTGWNPVYDGIYLWAVKTVYTGGVMSVPAFSNTITHVTPVGTIAGIVRTASNAPLEGATVTCGDVSATTNSAGAFSLLVEAGIHEVTASHPGYASETQEGVLVQTGQTTTLNFYLDAVANQDDNIPPARTELLGNTPNPFNPETVISYTLRESAPIRIAVYNLRGRLVRVLQDGVLPSGRYRVAWDGTDSRRLPVSSGVYFCRMVSGSYTATSRMALLK
jgi:hypothetical protein